MVYSPSQLDAAGDVDPVAEADVYLAYGRDLQAEEILKEALRTSPQRVAIHAKLLEIYAKRRDAKAFEVVATEAYNLTHGSGPEWEHICELGRELDASNPLYRPGGTPGESAVAAAATAAAAGSAFTATAPMAMAPPPPPAAATDIDLDLDFSLGDEPEASAPVPMSTPEPTLAMNAVTPPPAAAMDPAPLDMDFGSAATMPINAPAAQPEPVRLDAPDLTLDTNSLNFSTDPAPVAAPKAAAPAPAPSDGMIEFDLGGLSLDLPGDNKPAAPEATPSQLAATATGLQPAVEAAGETAESPLATKLALAEEFNAIGDADGARSLAAEVVAEASGDLKSRAERLLAEIG
jgi:pilus assembly protein FimV